ncbi:MAG: 50S ribosomal protein L4 [Thermotogae bacterium]|nr:50S ribosomal protein L4 [Thermotogota bacterium]
MANVELLNIKGEKVGTLDLSDAVFGIEPNLNVLFDYVDMQLTNKRSGTASTKTRSEVRGGGRKPWAQKHTGRARAGSIRSPLFRKGGVTFGPKPREYYKKLNKKIKRLALRSALSLRLKENNIMFIDDIKVDAVRTKNMKEILSGLKIQDKKVLMVLPYQTQQYKDVKLSAKNIAGLKVLIADNANQNVKNIDGFNVFDVINSEVLVLTKDMVSKIEEVLA